MFEGDCVRCENVLVRETYGPLSQSLPAARAMANAHEHDSETVRPRTLAADHDIKEQPVRIRHLSTVQEVDLGQCIIAVEDEDHSKNHLQQYERQVFDNTLLGGNGHHSRSPSQVSSNDEEAAAVLSTRTESGYAEARTEDKKQHERFATLEEAQHRRKSHDDHAVLVKTRTGQSQPLLLPTQNACTDEAIQESKGCIDVDKVGIRISSDSLCSPTAFSAAATAASLTCSSPPSCTSLGDGDSLNKTSAESEITESAEDLRRENVTNSSFHRQVTSTSVTSMHMVDILSEGKLREDMQEHQPRTLQRRPKAVDLQRLQGQECEALTRHIASRNGAYERIRCRPNHLLHSGGLQADTGDHSGDEQYEQKAPDTSSPHIATITNRSAGRQSRSQSPRHLLMPATGAMGTSQYTASKWASPASLSTLQSKPSSREAERPSHFSLVAAGEEEVKRLAATTSAIVTAGPGQAVLAREQAATPCSNGTNTTPCRGLGTVRQRSSLPSEEADLSCCRLDTPACCFCSSMTDIAFPPPPAHLVAKFVAYVFEPQLQRLQRRLEKDARHHQWRNLLLECSEREGGPPFQNTVTGFVPASRRMSAPGLLAASAATAGAGDAEHPERTHCASNGVVASEHILEYCTMQGKQANHCVRASQAATCDIQNVTLEDRAGKDNHSKATSRAIRPQCNAGDVADSRAAEPRSAFHVSTSAAAAAATMERVHKSALLALQLKQHLLSLVCYMERLLRRKQFTHEDSARASISPASQIESSIEEHRPGVFYQRHCTSWKDNDNPPAGGGARKDSNQFSFHIEQLLRADIVVQPQCPVLSQGKCERALPSPRSKSQRASDVAQAEPELSTSGSALARRSHDAMRADSAMSEKYLSAAFPREVSFEKTGSASEHEDARFPPAGPKILVGAMSAPELALTPSAKPGRTHECVVPNVEDSIKEAADMSSIGCKKNTTISASKHLTERITTGVTARASSTDIAAVCIRTSEDWLPRTPEDTVLLGAPPSMINYLIVFSPLLVLQTIQQIAVPFAGNDPRSSIHTALDSHCTVRESRQEAKERDSQSAKKEDVNFLTVQVTSQDRRTSDTTSSNAVISHFPPPFLQPFTEKAFKDGACGETACTATTVEGHIVCGGSTDRQELRKSKAEGTVDGVREAVLKVVTSRSEATTRRESASVPNAIASATAHNKTTGAAEAGNETAEALSERDRTAHKGLTNASRALQAELRSALCWADRGLSSLFRASSSLCGASSKACTCVPLSEFHSQHSNSRTQQKIGTDTNEKRSDEVTPELLTTALLLLRKAVQQSKDWGHPGGVRPCAFSQRLRSHCINDGNSVADAQLASTRWRPAPLSHSTSELLSFLTTMLDELDSRQLPSSWQNGHRADYSDRDFSGETHFKQEEAIAKNDGPTEDVLYTSSSDALANSNNCEEIRAGTDADEVSQRCDFTSPSLLPVPLVPHANGNAPLDTRLTCYPTAKVKEDAPSVFFAPLHYQRQGRLLDENGKRSPTDMKPRQGLLPTHVPGSGRGASLRGTALRLSSPAGDCDVKNAPLDDERTGEDDLAERVALEILAQLDDGVFLHDEDAFDNVDNELLQTDRQNCHGASRPQTPNSDYQKLGKGRNQNAKDPSRWLQEDSDLPSGRRVQNESGKIKKLPFNASGREAAPQGLEDCAQHPAKCCSSQGHEHVGGVSYHRAADVRIAAQNHQSRVSTEDLLPSHDLRNRGNRADDSVLTRDLGERASDSAVHCPDFFDAPLRMELKRIHRQHAHVTANEFRPSDTFQPPRLHGEQTVCEMAGVCIPSEGAVCSERHVTIGPTDSADRPLHMAVNTEAASLARDAFHTSFLCEEVPRKQRATNCLSEGRETSWPLVCTGTSDFSGRDVGQGCPFADYTKANDACTTRAPVLMGRKEQEQPRDTDTQECEARRRLQQRETEPAWTDGGTKVRKNPPQSACNRAESPSSMVQVSGLQHLTSDKRGGAGNEAIRWTWEVVEDNESSANTGTLKPTHIFRESERKAPAEDERRTHERQAGRISLSWHEGLTEGRQRSAHRMDTTEASSGEKGKEKPDCRRKRSRPDTEGAESCCKQYPSESRGNSTPGGETGVAVSFLKEEAVKVKAVEAVSRRTSSTVYNDSGGVYHSCTEGKHKSLLGNRGADDRVHAGMDTRRPMRGVYFDRTQRSWIGSFYEDRRQIKKRFKVDTYGFLQAKALAVDMRLGYERRMLRGVVGATGCATSSKAESTAQKSNFTSAGNAVSASVQVEESSGPEMVEGDQGSEIRIRNAANTPAEAHRQISSLVLQERATRKNILAIKDKRSHDAVRDRGPQTTNSIGVTPESQSSAVGTPPAHSVGAAISFEKLDAAMHTARDEEVEAAPIEWIRADGAAETWSGSGTSLPSSSALKPLSTHVGLSSDLWETTLDGENTRVCGAGGRGRVWQNASQLAVKLGDLKCTASDNLDTLKNCSSRVDAHASQKLVESAKMRATDVFFLQNRNDSAEKSTIRNATTLQGELEYLSHTYIRRTAAAGSTFHSQSRLEEEKKQNQEARNIERGTNMTSKSSSACREQQAQADTGGSSEEPGPTWQQKAPPEEACIGTARISGEGKDTESDLFASEYVGEERRSVSTRTAEPGQVENPADEDIVSEATSSGKFQDSYANPTQRKTALPSAPLRSHRRLGSGNAGSSTEEERNLLAGRLEDSIWHPHSTVRSLYEGADKETSGNEGADVKDLERGLVRSASFAPVSYTSGYVAENVSPKGRLHEARTGTEPAMHLRGGKKLTFSSSESSADVDRDRKSNFTAPLSARRSFCNRGCGNEYWPTRPSTKRPADVSAAAYMFSKRRKRPADVLCDSEGGTNPLFGQGLPLGVFYTSKKHAYCANWYEGKRQLKRYFPICKLGEPEARRLAIAARREAERREREARCRTGGSAFNLTACTEKRNLLSAGSAE